MKQWANLDFLRSVAVLLVVYVHTRYYTGAADVGWGGLTGVCFFFVHTSLVLMWSLDRDNHVGRFYVRRIFRIYPLWLVTLVLVVVLHIPISPLFAPHFGFHMPQLKEWPSEVLLLFNIRGGAQVVGASWTLPLEVQMYIFLPFLFFFVGSVRRLWPLLLVFAFVIFWDVSFYAADTTVFPVCIPYFLCGVMAYALSKNIRSRLPAWTFPVFLAGLTAFGMRHGTPRVSWGICLVLGLSLPHFRQMTWKPLLRASHLVARYSYGVYLSHFIAIAVGFYYLRGHALAWKLSAYSVTLVVLPLLFYHSVEEPMMRLGARLAKKIEPGPARAINQQALDLEPAP